jgi:hypothetical protein
MRSIAVSGQNVLLNGHPIYLMSALVQGIGRTASTSALR